MAQYGDIRSKGWSNLPNMTNDRWDHSCEVIIIEHELFIYVVGSIHAGFSVEGIQWKNPSRWVMISSLNVYRQYYPTLSFMQNHLIVTGGSFIDDKIEEFDF